MSDLRLAIRQLFKNPAFSTVAIVTLALGIDANTAIFSVVNAVLLPPLPCPQPEQLVAVWAGKSKKPDVRSRESPPPHEIIR
jgi:hypothetical protein